MKPEDDRFLEWVGGRSISKNTWQTGGEKGWTVPKNLRLNQAEHTNASSILGLRHSPFMWYLYKNMDNTISSTFRKWPNRVKMMSYTGSASTDVKKKEGIPGWPWCSVLVFGGSEAFGLWRVSLRKHHKTHPLADVCGSFCNKTDHSRTFIHRKRRLKISKHLLTKPAALFPLP